MCFSMRAASPLLLFIAGGCTLSSLLHMPILLVLLWSAIAGAGERVVGSLAAAFFCACGIVGAIAYDAVNGAPASQHTGGGLFTGEPHTTCLLTGLLGGAVAFGGDNHMLPFAWQALVNAGGWIPPGVFIDGIALAIAVPGPCALFIVFAAFQSSGIWGSLLIILGAAITPVLLAMFDQASLRAIFDDGAWSGFFDGIRAGVLGVMVYIVWELVQESVVDQMGALIFFLGLWAARETQSPIAPLSIIAGAAMAGQVLFKNVQVVPSLYIYIHKYNV